MSVNISDGVDSIDIEVEDIQTSLEEQDYGVVILPPNQKFFCLWSDKREILTIGHEIREKLEKDGIKCGYVLHG